MTVQEAIEYLKEKSFQDYSGTPYEMAIEALEKQIPKKPMIKNLSESIEVGCPRCDYLQIFIGRIEVENYCPYCGQKLDWN